MWVPRGICQGCMSCSTIVFWVSRHGSDSDNGIFIWLRLQYRSQFCCVLIACTRRVNRAANESGSGTSFPGSSSARVVGKTSLGAISEVKIQWNQHNSPVPCCEQLLDLCFGPFFHELDDRIIHVFIFETGGRAEPSVTAQPKANLVTALATATMKRRNVTIVAAYAIDSMVTWLTPHCLAYPPFVDMFDKASAPFEGLIVKCRRACSKLC